MLDSDSVPLKPQPDHRIYLATLRRMSPQQRLVKAFELSDNVRQLFVTDYVGDSLICPKKKFSNFIWIDCLCVTTGITEKGREGAGKTGC